MPNATDVSYTRSERYQRTSANQRYADLKRLFERVTHAYIKFRAYPVLAAVNHDSDPTNDRQHKWNPALAHYLCDVELATEAALQDEPDLQAAWFQLVAEAGGVPSEKSKQVITRCAKFYLGRNLDPHVYFNRGYE